MAKRTRKQRKIANLQKKYGPSMAELADRHVLYQNSVQDAETEIDFVDTTFEKIRGRKMKTIREDFSGTSQVCCEWVQRRPDNKAVGVDLDPEVLQWGRDHNLSKLNEEELSRLSLLEDNVLSVSTDPMDAVLAMNFSYWCFKDRDTLGGYFKRIHEVLKDDGIFFLDCFGGYEAFQLLEESTEHDDFTYTWDQSEYNPINGDYVCHIHFEFPDGSKIKQAFTYEWRLWTMPEIHELLKEAGFSKVTTYCEGDDEDDEGDGIYEAADVADADAGWVSYIVAEM